MFDNSGQFVDVELRLSRDEAARLLSGGVFIGRGDGSNGTIIIMTKRDEYGLSVQIRYSREQREGFTPEELPEQLELQRVSGTC